MAMAKFSAGDGVTVRATRSNPNIRPGIYKVVRPLPESSEGRQYRAKSIMDDHERVFNEAEMERA